MKKSEVNRNFHGPVDFGTGNSAEYVVAHARWQRSRGRMPSMSYGGLANPRLALEAAEAAIAARVDVEKPSIQSECFLGRVAIFKIWRPGRQEYYAATAARSAVEDGAIGAKVEVMAEGADVPTGAPSDYGTIESIYNYRS